jgi:predicted nucleic acid-binding protein
MLVITEVVHFVSTHLGPEAELRFLEDIASGALTVEPVRPSDWLRIAELVWHYRDLPLGTVDASVVATAERLNVSLMVTLDYRHFTVVRPSHVESFEILPAVN